MKIIDDTLRIPQLESGDKIYHYTTAEGLKGLCINGFWITERSFLNDSMEFQVATEVLEEVLDENMNNSSACKVLKKEIRKEVDRLQTPGILTTDEVAYTGEYILSFCLDYDSPLMWSSYSDFTGYCIGFDFDKLFSSFDAPERILHGQVIYDRAEQIKLITDLIQKEYFDSSSYPHLNSWRDLDNLSGEELADFVNFLSVEISAYNMFFKLPVFEGEHEYRMIFSPIHDGGRVKESEYVKQHFRIKDEVLIPYIEIKLSSIESIEKVMVGSKNKSDIAAKGVRCFFRNLKHDIIVEQSSIPLRY